MIPNENKMLASQINHGEKGKFNNREQSVFTIFYYLLGVRTCSSLTYS